MRIQTVGEELKKRSKVQCALMHGCACRCTACPKPTHDTHVCTHHTTHTRRPHHITIPHLTPCTYKHTYSSCTKLHAHPHTSHPILQTVFIPHSKHTQNTRHTTHACHTHTLLMPTHTHNPHTHPSSIASQGHKQGTGLEVEQLGSDQASI